MMMKTKSEFSQKEDRQNSKIPYLKKKKKKANKETIKPYKRSLKWFVKMFMDSKVPFAK